jgi:hypothetical protein
MMIFGVDVGSVRTERFAWACSDPADAAAHGDGRNPSTLADTIREQLDKGELVALGFECPLVLPVPELSDSLGAARVGEGNRPWAAGAGAGSMATGLVQLCWTLAQLVPAKATTQPSKWNPETPLLLWEAFVSGPQKKDRDDVTGHLSDARSAVEAFVHRLDNLSHQSQIHTGDHRPLNLAAVAAMHAGLEIDAAEIALPLMVAKEAIAT